MFKFLVLICCCSLLGCALQPPTPLPAARATQAALLAKTAGWHEHSIHTTRFTLKSYSASVPTKTDVLTVYIEGDGFAWRSENTPSDNPTPILPTGLKMALHDRKNHPVAYLARPCQFVFNEAWRGCQPAYWTHLRFSPSVIQAMNQALDYLKKYYHAKQIILIGYSGGGAIATLIAAKRTDVIQLITVAALLDTKYWVRQESLSPLYGSLNPADAWNSIKSIPQTHWVGGEDKVVPKEVAFSFANHFPTTKKPKIIMVPNFDHHCCWANFDLTH